jgi:periplasmic divalent cation tolerance protein
MLSLLPVTPTGNNPDSSVRSASAGRHDLGQAQADTLSGRIRAMATAGGNEGHRSITDVIAVLCTCPDAATARRLAGGLVERRLAACVNILPEIRSIYRWQGKICDDAEVLMIVKTTRRSYAELEGWLVDNHPYDVPEVVALPVAAGAYGYLGWVANETASE